MADKKHRISFDVNDKMKDILDSLCKKHNLKRAQLFKSSIALVKTISDCKDEGLEPALINDKQELRAKLVGIFSKD